jgi:hypothetical protein
MLRSVLRVDLPSEETRRRHSLFGLVRSALGRDTTRSGREELTISGAEVVLGIMRCLEEAGIDNAVSLIVDGEQVFVDYEGVDGDREALARAASRRFDGRSFGTLRLIAETRESGLHTIVAIHVARRVALGQKEMHVALGARPEVLAHRQGESPADYAARLQAFARSDGLERALADFRAMTERLGAAFKRHAGDLEVETSRIEAIVVRPTLDSIRRFPLLDFSRDAVLYQPSLSSTQRHPDRYHRYYVDPLYDFRSLVLIQAMVRQGLWRRKDVSIVLDNGTRWMTGEEIDAEECEVWAGLDALRFDEAGQMRIHLPE